MWSATPTRTRASVLQKRPAQIGLFTPTHRARFYLHCEDKRNPVCGAPPQHTPARTPPRTLKSSVWSANPTHTGTSLLQKSHAQIGLFPPKHNLGLVSTDSAKEIEIQCLECHFNTLRDLSFAKKTCTYVCI